MTLEEYKKRTADMTEAQKKFFYLTKLTQDQRDKLEQDASRYTAEEQAAVNESDVVLADPFAGNGAFTAPDYDPSANVEGSYSSSDMINVSGDFTAPKKPKEPTKEVVSAPQVPDRPAEPTPQPPLADSGYNPLSLARELARDGNLQTAQEVLRTAKAQKEVLDMFNRDLTPEAMFADRLRAGRYRMEGRPFQYELLGSGQFGGATPERYELERQQEADTLKGLLGTQNIKSAQAGIEATKANQRNQRDILKLRQKQFEKESIALQSSLANQMAQLKILTDNFDFSKDKFYSQERQNRISEFSKTIIAQAKLLSDQLESDMLDEEQEKKAIKQLEDVLGKLKKVEEAILK